MPDVSFNNLAIVLAVGFLTPLVLGFLPRVRVPAVVLEIVLGIIVGPSVLGWVQADETVRTVSIIGLAFLLFLAGLELDLHALRGNVLRLGLIGFGLTLLLAGATGFALDAAGLVNDPLLAAVILCATSLGLVIPVLKEAGESSSRLGQLAIVGASIGDFAAIILLSVLFSKDASDPSSRVVLLAEFALLVVAIALALGVAGRSMHVRDALVRLQDTTAEIRVRGAMLLVVVLVVFAEQFGLETILGAFIAGAVVGLIDRDAQMSHPQFRLKLEAIGYGFLIPVFFVTSGVLFDLARAARRRVNPGAGAGVPDGTARGAWASGADLSPRCRHAWCGGRGLASGDLAAVHRCRHRDWRGPWCPERLDGRRLCGRRPAFGAGLPGGGHLSASSAEQPGLTAGDRRRDPEHGGYVSPQWTGAKP